MCLKCAKKESHHAWLCTETRHYLQCYHVVNTQPSDCAYNCRNVPRAQTRVSHHDCRACDFGVEFFEFLYALYPVKGLEDELLLQTAATGPDSLSFEELQPLRAAVRTLKEELRWRTPRIFWHAYSRNGAWQLHKLLFRIWRSARRRKRAIRRLKYKWWLDTKEREVARSFAKGLRWLRRRRPDVVIKKMSERASRFEDYVQLRASANEPHLLTELRYRIGIAGKIMRYCGYNNRTFWENVDEDKDEIWTHLVKDGSSCYEEALPLDLLEQLQDILNEYRDDPLDFDDDWAEAEAPRIFDSDGELEDEVNEYSVGDDSYWGKINGSMDFERRLSLHPFGQNTSIRQAMQQLEGGYLPPPEVQNGGLSPSTATPPPTGLNGPVPFDQAPGAPNANLGTDMPDLTSEPQELEDRPPQWYEPRDNDIVSDSSDELGYP